MIAIRYRIVKQWQTRIFDLITGATCIGREV